MSNLNNINDRDFNSQILAKKRDSLVIVDFWASWCAPCKTMIKTLEEIYDDYKNSSKLEILKYNIEDNSLISSKYNILSIPTLIFFNRGLEVKKIIGLENFKLIFSAHGLPEKNIKKVIHINGK